MAKRNAHYLCVAKLGIKVKPQLFFAENKCGVSSQQAKFHFKWVFVVWASIFCPFGVANTVRVRAYFRADILLAVPVFKLEKHVYAQYW